MEDRYSDRSPYLNALERTDGKVRFRAHLGMLLKIAFAIDVTLMEGNASAEALTWCLAALFVKTMDPPKTPKSSRTQHHDWWKRTQKIRDEQKSKTPVPPTTHSINERWEYAMAVSGIARWVASKLEASETHQFITRELSVAPLFLNEYSAVYLYVCWSLLLSMDELGKIISPMVFIELRQNELEILEKKMEKLRETLPFSETWNDLCLAILS